MLWQACVQTFRSSLQLRELTQMAEIMRSGDHALVFQHRGHWGEEGGMGLQKANVSMKPRPNPRQFRLFRIPRRMHFSHSQNEDTTLDEEDNGLK